MQIDPTRLHRIGAANLSKVAPANATSEGASGATPVAASQSDQVVLSQTAAEVHAAQQALAATPDLRADKVAQIKAQMATGTYRADADKIAEKLIPE